MYRRLGASALELLWLSARPRARASELAFLDAESRAAFDRARGLGRGVVLAASHTGNWELAAFRVAEETSLLAVTEELHVRGFDGFARRVRKARGVLVATEGSADVLRARPPTRQIARRIRDMLRGGGIVAMMIDQVPARRRHALSTNFLGAPAFVTRGPAVLAARSGAPLLVAAARKASDSHALSVLSVHVPPPRAGHAWVDEVTRDATAALDRFVREHPDEWLWLHRRWKEPARGC
jgi:KDO2-lipid IV(A) lauroyltransferase